MHKIGMDLDQRTDLIRTVSFEKKTLDPDQFGENMMKKLYDGTISMEQKPDLLHRAVSKIRRMLSLNR